MTKQTTRDNIKDMITNLGGTSEGKTLAECLDELERIVGTAEGTVTEGRLTDQDIDEVFGD